MLKKFATLLLFPIVFACNSDDSSNDNSVIDEPVIENTVLISKIVETDYYSETGSNVNVIYFNYQNNRLVSTNGENLDYKEEFIYEGNKIVKTRILHLNRVLLESNLIYEGDKLKAIVKNGIAEERMEFAYNNNTLISRTKLHISNITNEVDERDQSNFTYTNGNISKINRITQYMTNPTYYETDVAFDSKNNPMRDMNPYFKLISIYESFSPLNANNTIHQRSVYQGTSNIASELRYEITYNENDFPVKIVRKSVETNEIISEIEFEYR